MPPNRQSHTLNQLAKAYPDNYLIGQSNDEPRFEPAHGSAVPEVDDKTLSAIAFTSGSTGTPKPNNKHWHTLRIGARSTVQLLFDGVARHFSMVATVPPQHMWGMEISIILPLFMPIAFLSRTPFYPQDIVNAIDELPDPVLLASSPIHLEALLRSGVKPQRLDRILTATAPLSRELSANLETSFKTRVQDVFGCTESGILAARSASVDELWTYSDSFDLQATQEGIRIRAGHLAEDVLLPDIVELIGDNQYRWVGRQADMVNIAGKRGSLSDLGHKLREVPGVLDAVVFVREERPDRLAALVVAPHVEEGEIIRKLRDKVDPAFLPRPLFKVEALPRQETGKLSIKAVQDLFAQIRAAGQH